eukprot:137064_1
MQNTYGKESRPLPRYDPFEEHRHYDTDELRDILKPEDMSMVDYFEKHEWNGCIFWLGSMISNKCNHRFEDNFHNFESSSKMYKCRVKVNIQRQKINTKTFVERLGNKADEIAIKFYSNSEEQQMLTDLTTFTGCRVYEFDGRENYKFAQREEKITKIEIFHIG